MARLRVTLRARPGAITWFRWRRLSYPCPCEFVPSRCRRELVIASGLASCCARHQTYCEHIVPSCAAFAAQLGTMCLALGSAMLYGIDLTRIRSMQRIRLRDARLCGAHRTTEHGRLPRTEKLQGLHVHNRIGRVLHRLSIGMSKQQKGAAEREQQKGAAKGGRCAP